MDSSTWLIKDDRINLYAYFSEVLLFYITWWTIYNTVSMLVLNKALFKRLPKEKRIEGKTRIVSSIYAIILTTASACYLLKFIDYESWIQFFPMSSAFGLFDVTIITINYRCFEKVYLLTCLHHFIVVFGPLTVTPEYSALISQSCISDATVPLIDISWYLYNAKLSNTLIFKLNSTLAIIVFFILRVVNSCYLSYEIIWHDNIILMCFSFVYLTLNIYWFKGLVGMYLRT